MSWTIINDKLRNELHALGLSEDSDGYYSLPMCEDWIIASYREDVRFVKNLIINYENKICAAELESTHFDVFTNEKIIIKKTKKLIKKYKELLIAKQLNLIKEDFV